MGLVTRLVLPGTESEKPKFSYMTRRPFTDESIIYTCTMQEKSSIVTWTLGMLMLRYSHLINGRIKTYARSVMREEPFWPIPENCFNHPYLMIEVHRSSILIIVNLIHESYTISAFASSFV